MNRVPGSGWLAIEWSVQENEGLDLLDWFGWNVLML